ncbi:MAG: hypothetical protein ACM3NE_01575 [Hyphomicrobiales bacterium]
MPQKQTEPEKPPVRHGQMSVGEAGRLGGQKGGQRVKRLIEEGKESERDDAGEMQNRQEDKDGEA